MISSLREDGDTEFMNVLANELVPQVWNEDLIHSHSHSPIPQGVFVFVTVGGEKGAGHFLLAGKDDNVAKLGPK